MKSKRKSSRGYTLLEIVIVVAVLAAICVISISVFSGVLKKTDDVSSAVLMRNAYIAYISENPGTNVSSECFVYSCDLSFYYMSSDSKYKKLPEEFPSEQLGNGDFKMGKCEIYDISDSTLICYLAYLEYIENTDDPRVTKDIGECVFEFQGKFYKFDANSFTKLASAEQGAMDNAIQNGLAYYKYDSSAHKVTVHIL